MDASTASSRKRGISVRSILPAVQTIGCDDLRVSSCCGHWSQCQPGDLFVAIDSPQGDGHDEAAMALKRGASGVVVERRLAVRGPQFLVQDSRQAFGLLCHALAGQPSSRSVTVAVAGTDGKTVTSHLVEAVLAAAGETTAISSCFSAENGHPGRSSRVDECPAALAGWLERQVRGGQSALVVETGCQALAQHALTGAAFDLAVITNLRHDGMDLDATNGKGCRLFERIAQFVKPGGMAILNADDPHSARWLESLDIPALTFGVRQSADVEGRLIESDASGQTFCLSAGDESAIIRTPVIGIQHVHNCLAAAAVGLTRGMPLEQIARALAGAPGLPGRLEPVNCGQEFGVWVDAARRPTQLAAAVQAVRRVCSGRLLVAATIQPGQSANQRRRIGEILQRRADVAVITQPHCGLIEDYEPAHQILDGFDDPAKGRLIPNRLDAIEWLLAEARPGDALLLAGTGELPIATAGDEDLQICDREVVQAWLLDRPALSPASQRRAAIYRMQDYLQ